MSRSATQAEPETADAMLTRLEALAASLEARERELVQARRIARLGTWRWSRASDAAVWSEEIYEILGVDPALPPFDYAAMQALHTPESAARRHQALAHVLEHGGEYEHEMELILPGGERRWIVMRGEPAARDADGKISEICGTLQDITERKQIELALRERERDLQEAQRINRIGTWTMNVPENRVWWSPEVYRAYAADPGQPPLRAAQLEPLHLNNSFPQMLQVLERARKTGEPYEIDVEIRALDGTRRWICARGEVSRWNAAGEVLELRGTIQDVTARKVADEAVRRTEKLAATGRLAASMAHEINNPLTAVTNLLYLALCDPALSQTTHACLKQAEQELARVAAVTSQTLRFHQQSTAPVYVDLGELMDSAIALFARRFHSRGIAIERDPACPEPLFCRDGELRQVFANLLSNALDATPHGGRVRIRIRAARSAVDGVQGIRVAVADTGQGIPEEIQPRIFEPFLSTKEATGTGLGLWVSQEIVEKHQGTIRVRSRCNPPAGTVFSLFFPHLRLPPG